MAKRRTKTAPPEAPATTAEAAMQIEYVPLAELQLDPKNAKSHGERDLTVTGNSLEEFGQIEPLIVWRGIVIAGNGRLMKMREQGRTHAAIRRVDYLSEPQARKLALVLNRSSQLATWNEAQLLETLRELESIDVDVAAIGFDRADLDALVNDALAAAGDVAGEPAASKDPAPEKKGKQKSAAGGESQPDRWQILITARDEMHHQELLDRFDQEGLECRALIS